MDRLPNNVTYRVKLGGETEVVHVTRLLPLGMFYEDGAPPESSDVSSKDETSYLQDHENLEVVIDPEEDIRIILGLGRGYAGRNVFGTREQRGASRHPSSGLP